MTITVNNCVLLNVSISTVKGDYEKAKLLQQLDSSLCKNFFLLKTCPHPPRHTHTTLDYPDLQSLKLLTKPFPIKTK